MRTRTLVGPSLVLLLGAACQEESSSSPAPPPSGPSQAAPPASQPGTMPTGHGLPPGHAPVPGSGSQAAAGGDPISGTISLGEGVDPSAIASSDVLFVMARKSQGGGLAGGLVAVKRMANLDGKAFPARFELGAQDAMMMGTPFAGPFVVYARLDRDGDPMTKTDEDLYATIPQPVANGATDLEMVLEEGSPKVAPAPPGAKPPPAK